MGPFTRKRQKMFFELDSALNLTTITKEFVANFTSLEYVVDLEAEIEDQDVEGGPLVAREKQSLTFIEKPYSEEVAKWVLVTSSGAGILLFLLILVCLISVSPRGNSTCPRHQNRCLTLCLPRLASSSARRVTTSRGN